MQLQRAERQREHHELEVILRWLGDKTAAADNTPIEQRGQSDGYLNNEHERNGKYIDSTRRHQERP